MECFIITTGLRFRACKQYLQVILAENPPGKLIDLSHFVLDLIHRMRQALIIVLF